jgi:hypothetical protein
MDALKTAWRKRHLVLAITWILLVVPALLWWKDSVLFVILLSLYANVEASLAAYNAQKSASKNE